LRSAGVALIGLALATSSCSASGAPTASNNHHPASAGEVACGRGHLTVSALSGGAGAGNTYQVIGFKYSGTSTCSLTGSPEVVALDSNGSKIVGAVGVANPIGGSGSIPTSTVTLHAGQIASVILTGTEIPTGQSSVVCQQYAASFKVFGSGGADPVDISPGTRWGSRGFPICSTLRVGPFAVGTTGGEPLVNPPTAG